MRYHDTGNHPRERRVEYRDGEERGTAVVIAAERGQFFIEDVDSRETRWIGSQHIVNG